VRWGGIVYGENGSCSSLIFPFHVSIHSSPAGGELLRLKFVRKLGRSCGK